MRQAEERDDDEHGSVYAPGIRDQLWNNTIYGREWRKQGVKRGYLHDDYLQTNAATGLIGWVIVVLLPLYLGATSNEGLGAACLPYAGIRCPGIFF
jgi:hypothetical protein